MILNHLIATEKAADYKLYLEGIYDTKVDLGNPIFEYEPKRAFNGDGYSISVYELPETIRSRFEAADEKLLTDFPKRPYYRDHWSLVSWREAPFDTKFDAYLDFVVSKSETPIVPGLVEQFKAIRKALGRKGTYYAIFHNDNSHGPSDVDLFIVDLIGGRLYMMNENT